VAVHPGKRKKKRALPLHGFSHPLARQRWEEAKEATQSGPPNREEWLTGRQGSSARPAAGADGFESCAPPTLHGILIKDKERRFVTISQEGEFAV
jgi:hypothetical protein